jgi:hypothetical protein
LESSRACERVQTQRFESGQGWTPFSTRGAGAHGKEGTWLDLRRAAAHSPPPAMANASAKASGILSRLTELEQAQSRMISGMQSTHASERDALRARIASAQARRRSAEAGGAAAGAGALLPAPVLMELDMREIDAAVQAASAAEQESAAALREAKDVVEKARLAAGGGGSELVVAGGGGPGAGGGGAGPAGVGFGADNEFIVKQVSVNLDDVERVINGSPLVEVCRAFGRPDAKYGNEVYCCVVPKRNVRVSEPMLMLYAQKYLSTALCPKRFFFLESLPTGITRKALADTRLGEIGTHSPNGAAAANQ